MLFLLGLFCNLWLGYLGWGSDILSMKELHWRVWLLAVCFVFLLFFGFREVCSQAGLGLGEFGDFYSLLRVVGLGEWSGRIERWGILLVSEIRGPRGDH